MTTIEDIKCFNCSKINWKIIGAKPSYHEYECKECGRITRTPRIVEFPATKLIKESEK